MTDNDDNWDKIEYIWKHGNLKDKSVREKLHQLLSKEENDQENLSEQFDKMLDKLDDIYHEFPEIYNLLNKNMEYEKQHQKLLYQNMEKTHKYQLIQLILLGLIFLMLI